MTQETFAIEKLNAKVEALSKQVRENTITYATIQNLKNTLEKFYQAKKELDETIKDFINLDAINKIKEEYKDIQELLNYFKTTDVAQRLKDIEMEIAILKEGGNI